MKYISALPLAASLAAAQMQVMSLAPQASNGPMVHTVRKYTHITTACSHMNTNTTTRSPSVD